MAREPIPLTQGRRGRIPPFPPTALGGSDGWEFEQGLPRVSFWTRVGAFFLRFSRRAR